MQPVVSDVFARPLYDDLIDMGQLETNPALEIIKQVDCFQKNTKYPKDNLRFDNSALRAYYHSHESPLHTEDEHGHFHLFTGDADKHNDEWSHLVGLSVDYMGQPLRWFVVNRWVTSGHWLSTDELDNFYAHLTPAIKDLSLVERWLLNMLGFYRQEIRVLYSQRDQELTRLNDIQRDCDIFDDRAVYDLARLDINLLEKFNA